MLEPLVLVDPGLMVPPGNRQVEEYREFWVRLVEWAADRRVRLGRYSYLLVLEQLGDSWPETRPPYCPPELSHQANFALNTLLAAIAAEPSEGNGRVDKFAPEYNISTLRDGLALDVAEQYHAGLLGAASRYEHWSEPADVIALMPGPPQTMRLAVTPGVELPGEADFRTGQRLKGLRVTIVGGMRSDETLAALGRRFQADTDGWRWISAEAGHQPDLDGLRGMRADRDSLICLAGFVSHAAGQKAIKTARGRGVTVLYANSNNEIVTALRDQYGRG